MVKLERPDIKIECKYGRSYFTIIDTFVYKYSIYLFIYTVYTYVSMMVR
jgi:hypothetical protein